jgi:hypothetical protein
MADRALEGLRIIEFCDELGSYCGRLLADLGAEVIKVEPPGGDSNAHSAFSRFKPDTSLAFWVHNTSKSASRSGHGGESGPGDPLRRCGIRTMLSVDGRPRPRPC